MDDPEFEKWIRNEVTYLSPMGLAVFIGLSLIFISIIFNLYHPFLIAFMFLIFFLCSLLVILIFINTWHSGSVNSDWRFYICPIERRTEFVNKIDEILKEKHKKFKLKESSAAGASLYPYIFYFENFKLKLEWIGPYPERPKARCYVEIGPFNRHNEHEIRECQRDLDGFFDGPKWDEGDIEFNEQAKPEIKITTSDYRKIVEITCPNCSTTYEEYPDDFPLHFFCKNCGYIAAIEKSDLY